MSDFYILAFEKDPLDKKEKRTLQLMPMAKERSVTTDAFIYRKSIKKQAFPQKPAFYISTLWKLFYKR
ncbi:MAG: hypothetical protein ABJA32_05310 [Ginsengibacter sp.]|jgi:hypothetical protein